MLRDLKNKPKMKTYRDVVFFAIIFMSVFICSCRHEIPAAPPAVVTPIDTVVCFENDILPIFQNYCAKSGCHDTLSASETFVFDSYTHIIRRWIIPGNAAGSRVFQLLAHDNSNIMPLPPNAPLLDTQIALIEKWINQGAKNTTGCTALCDNNKFTYAKGVQPILQTHCLGCHGGIAEAGNFIVLDNYDSVKVQVTRDLLLPSITHTNNLPPMPQNGSKLNDCKIAIIRKWIESGAPNN
jgi:hypothetical protein